MPTPRTEVMNTVTHSKIHERKGGDLGSRAWLGRPRSEPSSLHLEIGSEIKSVGSVPSLEG